MEYERSIGYKEHLPVDRKPDFILDVQGSLPALSLLKVSRLYRDMGPDQVLEIRGCDPSHKRDLEKLLPDASFEFDSEDPPTEGPNSIRVRLTKTH